MRTRRSQNLQLLRASYLFYAAWDWRFVSLLMVSTVVDHAVGLRLHRPALRGPTAGAFVLIVLLWSGGSTTPFIYFQVQSCTSWASPVSDGSAGRPGRGHEHDVDVACPGVVDQGVRRAAASGSALGTLPRSAAIDVRGWRRRRR